MKKKLFIIYVLIGVVLFSCTPDKTNILEQSSSLDQVKIVKIKPNSHILYADNISELNLDVEIYEVLETIKKEKITLPDGTFTSRDSLHIDTVRLQNSRFADHIKFYKDDGTELPNGKFKTSTVEDFNVYAQVGNIKSELLAIDVRTPFPLNSKKVIPVIFHIIRSKDVDNTPDIVSGILQAELDKLNTVFGRKMVFASNGANANIEFKLALYGPDGSLLEEEGIDRQYSSKAGEETKAALVANTWDPKKYLNIFVCTYPSATEYPNTRLAGVDTIPGLSLPVEVAIDEDLDLSNPKHNGIIIGATYSYWSKAYSWKFYGFDWLDNIGKYLGLYVTGNWNIDEEIDVDYCSDTYTWVEYSSTQFWKKTLSGFVYESQNIMDYRSSSKTVISGEQVERIHWVLENCPTHWAWKSDFAFTGN